jgi:hypothetical protein
LRTTLDDHVDQFNLFALLELNFKQLVDGFLGVEGIHDGQIDHPAQINEVRFGTVFNTLLLGNSFLVVFAIGLL